MKKKKLGRPRLMKRGSKRINLDVDPWLFKELKKTATKHGVALNKMLRDYLSAYHHTIGI